MSIKIKGLDKLSKDLKKFGKDGERELRLGIEFGATDIERGAIANLNRYPELNFIRNRLNKTFEDGGLTAKVGVEGSGTNPIPAYHEFGTGTNYADLVASDPANYDSDVQALALTFKKSGLGTLPATPYLFPSFFVERPKIIEEIKKRLEKLAKQV